MDARGNIKQFDTKEQAINEGFLHQLTPEEMQHVIQFPPEEREERLLKFREIMKARQIRQAKERKKLLAQTGDGKHTKSLYKRPSGNKKKMIAKSKQRNRR